MVDKRCSLCVIILTFYVAYKVQCHDEEAKAVSNVLNRIRLLEKRLNMEISMLRQEFQSELALISVVSKVNKSDVGDGQSIDIEAEMSTLEKRVSDYLKSMKMGIAKEKVYRRDLQEQVKQMSEENGAIQDTFKVLMNTLISKFDILTESLGSIGAEADKPIQEHLPQDCADLLRTGYTSSGVYSIHPDSMWRPLKVYCDMDTEDGGWTVFQRRMDGSEDFYRTWMDYRFGFGDLSGEFWLGNEYIHRLVSQAPHEMRVELEDFENDRRFAKYLLFSVGSVDQGFKLSYEGFKGNVSDSLSTHNGRQFSTKDKGPSVGCSKSYKGGFWYNQCHGVNVNGLYLKGEHKSYADGVNWSAFKGQHYSLKFTEMKFRPK